VFFIDKRGDFNSPQRINYFLLVLELEEEEELLELDVDLEELEEPEDLLLDPL
jgi:hypothetical protein